MEFINTCFATTNEVRILAYYSHLVPTICSLILGGIVFWYAQHRHKAWLFYGFTVLLSLWMIGDLITWTSDNYYTVAAFWSTLDYLNILFYLFIFAFAVIDFTRQKTLPRWVVAFALLASFFPFIITVSGLAVHEFDEPNCEMYGNDSLALYKLAIEWLTILGILALGTIESIRRWGNTQEVRRITLLTFTTVAFLGIFSSTEYIATATDIYEITLYALFVSPLFVLLLAYTIIEQKTFRLRLDSIWTVRILFGLFILIEVFNLLLARGELEIFLSLLTVAAATGFGLLFLRSAGREAKQRQEIEKLALQLERANTRLKQLDKLKSEFVSIASHQLRSPLTSIRGYASMLVEGSFGKIPEKAKEALKRIEMSAYNMALSVEDYLNVSRIESGNMKYDCSDFNLKEVSEQIVDDLRPQAMKKGLVLTFKSDMTSTGIVNGDLGKTTQILHNLINNALKYTPKGKITVLTHDNKAQKQIHVEIIDTGVGMNPDTIEHLFDKFERAKDANKVNTEGTGLGLFVARAMARAMKGDVTAYSEGEGKGSHFILTLPLQM